MKTLCVIPARYNSSRFPGKPLAPICNKPMIVWVYEKAKEVKGINHIIVATDDYRIKNVCDNYKIDCMITSEKHLNGTERVAEVAERTDYDYYITIQGDEPLTKPSDVEMVVEKIKDDSDVACVTLKTAYKDPVDVINGTTPKCVTDLFDNVLIFTRSPIPYPKAALNYTIYKPIGIYGFKRDKLLTYTKLKIGSLETIEEIELLRFIENGMKVRIYKTESPTIAVDTPKDLLRVEKIILGGGNEGGIIITCNQGVYA